jgi:hypothetical protein
MADLIRERRSSEDKSPYAWSVTEEVSQSLIPKFENSSSFTNATCQRRIML